MEQFSEENLKHRTYAFDGTVTKVDASQDTEQPGPDRVTLRVTEWFKGGSGSEAVRKAYGFGAVTSAGGQPHGVGDRLLVAGDDDFIWSCGFTQDYTAEAASTWRKILQTR